MGRIVIGGHVEKYFPIGWLGRVDWQGISKISHLIGLHFQQKVQSPICVFNEYIFIGLVHLYATQSLNWKISYP